MHAVQAPVIRRRMFATTSLAAPRQVEGWEAHNAAALIALACLPPTSTEFDAIEVNLELAEQVHIARVRGTRHRVERPAELVESNPADAITVYVSLRGEAVFEHGRNRRVLRPGQLLVCDPDLPFNRTFQHGLDEIAVKVPRERLSALTGIHTVPEPIVVDVGPSGDQHGRTLAQLLPRALRRENALPVAWQTIIDLVGVLASDGRIGSTGAHRAAARGFIDEHFMDARLSAKDVAEGTGISERHLSRVFAQAGTSVPREVLTRRLDAAHHLLATANDSGLLIQDVAARCGFTSSAYFAERFRARFGLRARDVKAKVIPHLL